MEWLTTPESICALGRLEVVIDKWIPLTQTKEDGTVVQVLAFRLGNKLLVNPRRYDEMVLAATERKP